MTIALIMCRFVGLTLDPFNLEFEVILRPKRFINIALLLLLLLE